MADDEVPGEGNPPNPNPTPDSGSGGPSSDSACHDSGGATSVQVHLFLRGRGPVDIFRSSLGGPGGDRLDVRAILAKHGLRSLFAFKPPSERGFPVRFSRADGRSLLRFRGGAVLFLDGEPKGSILKPITAIVIGMVVPILLVAIMIKDIPASLKSSSLISGLFPPWILACALIIFSCMRKKPRVS